MPRDILRKITMIRSSEYREGAVKDTSVDGAIKKALARRNDGPAGECPDENVLAAYLEMRLDEAERLEVESHAASCASCQQTVGLALRMTEQEGRSVVPEPEPASRKRILFHFSLPVSTFAMLVLALCAGVLFYRVVRESSHLPPPAQTAQLRTPAQAEGISAPKASEGAQEAQLASGGNQAAGPGEKVRASTATSGAQTARLDIPAKDGRLEPVPTTDKATHLQTADAVSEAETKVDRQAAALPQPALEAAAPQPFVQTDDRGIPAGRAPAIATATSEYRSGGLARSRAELTKMSSRPVYAPPTGLQKEDFLSVVAPRDAVANLTGLASSEQRKRAAKKLGDRTFYRSSGYWIDDQCIRVSADYEEAADGSAERAEILKSLPELAGMRPAILYWKGKILVLR